MTSFGFETTGLEVVKTLGNEIKGKTILITGTSSGGLGAETATLLASGAPEHLLLLARSAAKVEPVIAKIKEINPQIKTTFVAVELDDQDSVRAAAAKVNAAIEKLDILINNAGIMAVKEYTTSKQGVELQFATNHIGHFLLTNLLLSKIQAAGSGSRIINVTSNGYLVGPCRLEDYNFKDGKEYETWSAYGQSKTANILFTRYLASKLKAQGITSYAVHPGLIFGTGLGTHLSPEDFGVLGDIALKNTGVRFELEAPKSLEQGVATALVAALDPSMADYSGSYVADCTAKPMRDYASSLENAQRLWTVSEKLVNEQFSI